MRIIERAATAGDRGAAMQSASQALLAYPRAVHPALPGLTITLLFFLGVEGMLCASGVSTLAETSDPFQGFSERSRVYGLDSEHGEYQRAAAAAGPFNQQRFRAEKAPEGFRFFVLGGSSAYGFPWGADAAFPRHLGDALQAAWPSRSVEAINSGGMSYASHRLRILTHELLDYAPDLLVIYGGHNEFVERSFYSQQLHRPEELDALRDALHHTRIYSAMTRLYESARLRGGAGPQAGSAERGLQMNVDREVESVASPAEREEVRALFEENLRAILVMASEAGVPVLLCTVPSNFRDWAPQLSSFPLGLSAADRQAVEAQLGRGRSELGHGDAVAALAALEAARERAPGHAELLFQLGRAYEALERFEDARAAYVGARDSDASPNRALGAINETIRRLASEQGVPLIDIERSFERRAPHGLLGFNLFEDYVHPTREAHKVIALELWQHIMQSGLLGEARSAEEESFWAALGKRVEGSDLQAAKPESGASAESPALLFNLGVVLSNRGLDDQALEKFRQAVALDPNYWGAWLNIGMVHARGQRYDAAIGAYRNVLRIRPGHLRALLALGWSLRHLGRLDAAGDAFSQATRSDPKSAVAWSSLGSVQLEQGHPSDAEPSLRRALALDPRDAEAHWMLGAALGEQQRHSEAVPSLEAALRLQPGHPEARAALDRIRRQQGG